MNSKKAFKSTLFLGLFSIGFSTIIFSSSFNDNLVSLISKTLLNSTNDSNNYETQAKVDPMFTISTIRKANSDRNAINLLYLGNGYNETETKTFADFVYNKRIKDYFNGSAWNQTPSTTFTKLFNNINVYAISPNFTGDDSQNKGKGFFGFYNTGFNSVEQFGYKKANLLNFDFVNNFADSGTTMNPWNLNIVNKTSGIRAVTNSNITLTSAQDSIHTGMHELGHLAFDLADEYEIVSFDGPNRSNGVGDPDKIKWKEFLNYRDIGINKVSGLDSYIPTQNSKMNTATDMNFKEVSEHAISKKINEELNLNNELYIADPQLIAPNESLKGPSWLKDYDEVYDENITNVNGKKLELTTVIDNWSKKNRIFKLRIKITDSSGNTEKFIKESDPYTLEPGKIKGMFLKSDSEINGLLNSDKIIGEVIDCDTNEILATSRDRMNSRIYDENNPTIKLNLGTKMYNVNVDYKIKSTNKAIPNTYPTSLRYSDGDVVPINKIIFNGYKFVESSKPDMKVQLNGKDENVTLYYEPLKFKNINLKLFDEDKKTLLDQKQVKVFEHQTFVPRKTDFWAQNLQENNGNNIKWDYKVNPESDKAYSYDDISDNNITINYYRTSDESNIILTKKVISNKGEKIIFGNPNNVYMFTSEYEFDPGSIPAIIYNDVDINTPGDYKIIYYSSDTSQATLNVTIKDREMPKDWVPNYLDAEISRVGSLFFLLKNRTITKQEYDKINESNLLSMFKNPVIDNDKFKYSVVIDKKNDSFLNFYINITYNGETKKVPNSQTLFFDVISDGNTNPPIIPEKKKNIDQAMINFVNGYKYYYTGKKITPEIVVTYKDDNNADINLVANQDYQISYENNIDVGQATIIINGINDYKGLKKITFDIIKVVNNSITDFKIENNKPVASASFGNIKYRYCKEPTMDNCVYYDAPIETGTWYVQAYVKNTNNYNGFFSDWKVIDVKNLSDFNSNSNDSTSKSKDSNQLAIIVGVIVAVLAIIGITGGIIISKIVSKKKFKTIKI